MFRHIKIRRLISAYLDGELSPADKKMVEEHIEKCARCRKYLQDLQKISSTIKRWNDEDVSLDLEQKIKGSLSEEKSKGVLKMKSKMVPLAIPVALVTLLAFVLVGGQLYLKRDMQGRFKSGIDRIGDRYEPFKQYEPYYIESKYRTGAASNPKSTARDRSFIAGGSLEGATFGRRPIDGLKKGKGIILGDAFKDVRVLGESKNRGTILSKRPTGNILTSPYHSQRASMSNLPITKKLRYTSDAKKTEISASLSSVSSEGGPIVIVEKYLPATGREDKIVRDARLNLEVTDVEKVYDEVVEAAKENAGYVSAANFEEKKTGKISANIILRIPREKFEDTLERIRKLGKVKKFYIQNVDVSQEYSSLVSRLNTLKIVYDKIAAKLKSRRTDVESSVRIESELSPIARRMDNLRSRIAYYDNLIAMSTITVNLSATSWKLLVQGSFKETYERLVNVFSDLVRKGVDFLPLILAAVIGLAVAYAIIALIVNGIVKGVKKLFRKKSQKEE